jgi:signal transduction histidine kinase
MRILVLLLSFLSASFLAAEDCATQFTNFDKSISLKGGWHYMKGDNPDWKEVDTEDSGWMRKSLPDYTKDKEKRAFGFYWYRCHIFFSEGNVPKSLGIKLGKLRDADEVYWNGIQIGSTGKFVPTVEIDIEKDRIYSIPDNLLRAGKNVLSVRIYASTRYYGIRNPPEIGKEWDVIERNVRIQVLPIVSGFIFILMGIFFIVGSIVRSQNQSNLLFSLFSIFLGFYTLLRTSFRYEFFTNFAFSYAIELVVLFLLPILFINFIAQYLEVKRKPITYIYDIVQFGLACFAYFSRTPNKWDWLIDINAALLVFPTLYVLYLIYSNYQFNVRKMRYIIVGTVGLLPCVVLDTLRALEFVKLESILHFGFLFFLINISIQLSEEMVQNYKNYIEQESELVKMEKVKTNFIFNVSTEFRAYLDKALKLCKELLVGGLSEKEIIEKLTKLESLGGLTKSVINDAIILNAIESGKYEIFTERFSLNTLLEEIILSLEVRHNQKRENLKWNFEPEILLQHNKELCFLIFYHLLENEFLYTPKETLIEIEAREQNGLLLFQIKDSGPGVLETVDIFKKFVRGSTVLEKDLPGSGIGLTLVRAICEKVGGTVEVETHPGAGFKVQLEIPMSY